MTRKMKDIRNISRKEISAKLKELKIELIKKNVVANKSSKIKAKEIKKAVARLLMLKNKENGHMP